MFLGAAPGVGKTYAMLQAAHRQLRLGHEVLVGVVESHGRAETEALRVGLPEQPLNRSDYRGVTLVEMDLDGLLRARPGLVLVDELAHSNAPGSRHSKRWQDVLELLEAGIDVYTTVNVQHLESLNDQVRAITGVQVRETVPDWVLHNADEILLIDLPPRELLERLREGKVYVPEQARAAIDAFFTQTNLTALRELAMQTAAARVDADLLRRSRRLGETAPVVRGRLLVGIDGDEYAGAWYATLPVWPSGGICLGQWSTSATAPVVARCSWAFSSPHSNLPSGSAVKWSSCAASASRGP